MCRIVAVGSLARHSPRNAMREVSGADPQSRRLGDPHYHDLTEIEQKYLLCIEDKGEYRKAILLRLAANAWCIGEQYDTIVNHKEMQA